MKFPIWQKRILTFIALASLLILILALTLGIFGLPVWHSLGLIYQGSFGDKIGFGRTCAKTCPLILTGLGVTVAWRAGMFNIGGEGQYVIGGLAGAWGAKVLMNWHIGGFILLSTILLLSIIGGGFYGWIAGYLKVKRSVDVVISTILLNFIAIEILHWAVSGPLMEAVGGIPITDQLPQSAMIWHPDPQTDFHVGIFIGIFCAFLIWFFLYRTTGGFKLRVVGDNPYVARANRISAPSSQLLAMAISGALCGLAGGIEYTAINGQIGRDFNQNWGFLGIPVAILGGLHPLYLLLSALSFGAMLAGSFNLSSFTHLGDTIIYVVQAIAVLAVVAIQSFRSQRKPSVEDLS